MIKINSIFYVSLLGSFFALTACGDKKETVSSSATSLTSDSSSCLQETMKVIVLKKHPESVIRIGDRYFISCVGEELKPMDKDGDGVIIEVDKNNQILSENVFPEVILNAPKGMVVLDGILYAADVDRIVGLDLVTKKVAKLIDLSSLNTSFLNDLVATKSGDIYASATDINMLVKVNPREGTFVSVPLDRSVLGPNGLILSPDEKILYVAGYASDSEGKGTGLLWSISLQDNKAVPLSDVTGSFDGIALVGNELFFGDWDKSGQSGAIRKLNLETKEIQDMSRIDIQGPADFFVDNNGKEVWIPSMMNKKVIHAPLISPSIKKPEGE